MIEPEIKEIFAPAMDPVETYSPLGDVFEVVLQVIVGAKGEEGGDIFHLIVVSPANTFRFEALRDLLDEQCRAARSTTWQDVSDKLSRIMRSEFEDYSDAPVSAP